MSIIARESELILPEGTWLEQVEKGAGVIHGIQRPASTVATWGPAVIPGLRRRLALSLHHNFMCSPTWGETLSGIPAQCQFLLWEEEGRYGVLLPLLDGDYRTTLSGCAGGLQFDADAGPSGIATEEVQLAYLCTGDDPYEVIARGIRGAVARMGRGRLREEKSSPAFIDYPGWCTWDAFYEKYDEAVVLKGLAAFKELGVTPGFVILDEGWQDYDPKQHALQSYGTNARFCHRRLQSLVAQAKSEYGVRYMGCWHTLFGELRGVDTHAPALAHLRSHDILEPNTDGDIFGVVELQDVPQFFDEYHLMLAGDGVDFVKVDFQSALHLMTYDRCGRAGAMAAWQEALQASVQQHFGGQMLNCMSAGSDAVYSTRHSVVTRSSDDFTPAVDGDHPRHITHNAFNSLWLGQLTFCDWDMFHSQNPWAEYHAMGRAISGGPVYVSDVPGHSDTAVLQRLVAADGRVLRCPQPALPTRDLLFTDCRAEQRLLKVFNIAGNAGLLGLFHPLAKGDIIEESIGAWQVNTLPDGEYAVYSIRQGWRGLYGFRDEIPVRLSPRQADILVFSPATEGVAVIGLIDKYNPPAAVLEVTHRQQQVEITLRGGGRLAVYCPQDVTEVLVDDQPVAYQREGELLLIDTAKWELCRVTVNLSHRK